MPIHNIINDKRLFLKRVKDFYQSKGTDKSLILLFRMLFNEEVEVYYPKNDMLRVSAGNFTSDIILNIKNLTGDSALHPQQHMERTLKINFIREAFFSEGSSEKWKNNLSKI